MLCHYKGGIRPSRAEGFTARIRSEAMGRRSSLSLRMTRSRTAEEGFIARIPEYG